MALLAENFIKLSKGQEISPALFNSAAFMQTSGWNGIRYFNPYYKDRLPYPAFLTMKRGEGILFYCVTKTRNQGKEIFSMYVRNPNMLIKIKLEYERLASRIDRLYRTYTSGVVKTLTVDKLITISKDITKTAWQLNALLFFTIPIDERLVSEVCRDLKLYLPKVKITRIWELAAALSADSFDVRRKAAFAQLRSQGESWESIASQLQYFYAYYFDISKEKQVLKHLKHDYKNISSIETSRKYIADIKKSEVLKNDHVRKQLNKANELEGKLAKFIAAAISWRDERKDSIGKALVVNYNVANAIFKTAKVSPDFIYYYTLPELYKGVNFLRKQSKHLAERKKGFSVLVSDSGKLSFEFGKHEENKQYMLKYNAVQSNFSRNGRTVTGQTGHPGKVKGKACVIMNLRKDLGKFKQGNILITGMTRPEMVPLMRKASAIVTDEGGITSHAAIVSRELGIPCIIGTKAATQFFQDGDSVEVDANRGVVTLIT